MKKILLILFIMLFSYILIGNVVADNDLIPDEAIRIRIIANSNSSYDQSIKYKVKNSLENKLYTLLKNSNSIDQARIKISDNINEIKKNIDETLHDNNYNLPFKVNFGLNYFPEKKFKGIIYKDGYYESLVVTLGEGLGDNWWCVLFPPLCMIEAEESSDVEYTTMVKTIMDKYF